MFTSDYSNVMRGRWSPHEGKISEPLCRQVLEHLFEDDFPSTRSVLLPEHNGTEFAWELDGYCEQKRLAFEYQGHPCHWNPEDPNYEKTSQRDAQKKVLCDDLGITLIQIPAFTKGSIWAQDRIYQHVLAAVQDTFAQRQEAMPTMNAAAWARADWRMTASGYGRSSRSTFQPRAANAEAWVGSAASG